MSIILGIDPGSRKTGFGIIQVDGRPRYLGSGIIRLPDVPLPERLRIIADGISDLIEQYRPAQAAVEEVFMARNAASALKLGQARGAALVACARAELDISEYTARQVKQAVVGTGAAAKEQVQHMVRHLLDLPALPPEDAADALACALCHVQVGGALKRLGKNRAGVAVARGLRAGRAARWGRPAVHLLGEDNDRHAPRSAGGQGRERGDRRCPGGRL